MTKTSKLETLKALVREWDSSNCGGAEAYTVCKFLADNLGLSKPEQKPNLLDALNDDAMMQRVMEKSAEMQAETIKKAEVIK